MRSHTRKRSATAPFLLIAALVSSMVRRVHLLRQVLAWTLPGPSCKRGGRLERGPRKPGRVTTKMQEETRYGRAFG
jgi:hypothetical protein